VAANPPRWSLLELLPETVAITVLDVGAALVERPIYQHLVERGRARIIGFEPDAQECERLNRTYGGAHCFLPHFVGDGNCATFHRTNWGPTGSLYEPNTLLLEKFQNLAEVVTPIGTAAVETVRLDDLPEVGDIDFFKIDVQGSELSVFRSGERVLAGVVAVQTEVEFVELYRGQPMFADVDSFLRSRSLQFHTFAGFGRRAFKPVIVNNDVNRGLRQDLWADAVYVRDWMRLHQLTDNKLLRYALISHDLFDSYDLAHYVLMELDRRNGSALAQHYLGRLMQPGPTRS
jgi:FkbM family methyltransferase